MDGVFGDCVVTGGFEVAVVNYEEYVATWGGRPSNLYRNSESYVGCYSRTSSKGGKRLGLSWLTSEMLAVHLGYPTFGPLSKGSCALPPLHSQPLKRPLFTLP